MPDGHPDINCDSCISGTHPLFRHLLEHELQEIMLNKDTETFKRGTIVYRSVVSNEPACTTTKVIEEATLCQIPTEMLLNLVKNNGNFAVELMKLTCKELGEANTYITNIAQKSVKERLAEILLHLYDEFGEDTSGILNISLTREELSNIVGTATESIIRLLSEFRIRGYIEINGRKIKILDKPGLKHIANI